MKTLKIDPLDLLNFPRKPEQEVTDWAKSILAAKGVPADKIVGCKSDMWGNIIVEYEP